MKVRSHLLLCLCAACFTGAAHADLLPGLVAYYDFEDLANDPAATGPPASEAGTGGYAGAADGVAGSAAEFTGTANDHIAAALSFGPGDTLLGTAFTVSAWYRLDADAISPTNRFFVFEGSTDYDISYGVRAFGGAAGFNDTQTYTHSASPPDLFLNHLDVHEPETWQHVLMTYASDGTTTTLTTYIDGRAVGLIQQPTVDLSSEGIHIGNARATALTRPFDGKIDEFAAWSRVLGSAEIDEVRRRGLAGLAVTADLASLGKAFIHVGNAEPTMGSVSGGGIFDLAATTPVAADPAPGHVFTGWSGSFSGQPASFTHTVAGPAASTAGFQQDAADADGDGLTNYQELVVYNTLPDVADTDGDQLSDGAEVLTLATNPNISDAAAVDYILANLCAPGSGGATVLQRDPLDNTVTVKLTAAETATLQTWAALLPSTGGLSLVIDAAELRMSLPGNSAGKRFFRYTGSAPAP